MGASAAELILVSVVHNGHTIDTPVGFSYERPSDEVVVRGPGKIGPSARGEVAGDFVALIDFIGTGFMAVNDIGSLVITTKNQAGATKVHTMATMKAGAYAQQGNRDAPPFIYRQRFAHQGDMDAEPYSVA